MIVIGGTARVKPDKRAEAEVAVLAAGAATRQEPGHVAYRFAWDVEDPDVVHIFEEWETPEALDAHFATPHLAEFVTALGEIVVGQVNLYRYDVSERVPLFG